MSADKNTLPSVTAVVNGRRSSSPLVVIETNPFVAVLETVMSLVPEPLVLIQPS